MQALLSGERNEAEMEDGNQTALNGRFGTPTRPAQPQERLRRAPTRQSKATMMLTPHFLHLGDMATGACSAHRRHAYQHHGVVRELHFQ